MNPVVHVLEISITPAGPDAALKLPAALAHLVADDPTLAYSADRTLGCFNLKGTGETHLEGVIDRLLRESGVRMTFGPPLVAFRETITKRVEHDYTHKKQTDGAGEFARLKLRFEPQPRGAGFAFVNAIAGVLPDAYVSAVEAGVQVALQTGAYAGYPTIDFRATLIDAAYHDPDSNARTFETAARACFREGMAKAGPQLLEPVMRAEVTAPAEHAGDVIADLNGRGAAIGGMDSQPDAWIIHALMPMREMFGYINRLRGLTSGRAGYTMAFDHYAPVPHGSNLDPIHPGAAIGLRIA
jgi:elongation factor G